MADEQFTTGRNRSIVPIIALVAGPLMCIVVILFFDLYPGHPEVTRTAAVALLMAVWWITEAVPLAVTSLLPMVLFPFLGIMNGNDVAPQYFNYIIFLFLGGFLVALAMQRWNLHKRIALKILLRFGIHPRSMILGFMVATGFLSMWISNTATTMMMVPIVLAIILNLEGMLGKDKVRKYAIGAFLAVAYSSSIGGLATIVGTPPNLVFLKILSINFPNAPEISFAKWMEFAFPVSVVFMLLVWLYLAFVYCPRKEDFDVDIEVFRQQYRELGPLSYEERIVLVDFVLLALLWLFRADITIGKFVIPGWSSLFKHPEYLNDGTVAITMAVVLFLIPAKRIKGSRIMDWNAIAQLPWNIILLFGGGFALASGFVESGLSQWLGTQLQGASSLQPIFLIALICLFVTFLTEMTSNTATAQMLLPILGSLAIAVRVNPLLLMIPGTLSCSCAFMLPVATPPNAIIFGTERLRISDMARTGLLINFLGALIITIATYFLGRIIFGIDLAQMPDWAVLK
jgi:sodium-dependent dicarboxylate transporter 2/3/5